jgi:hypothetical protein
VPKGTSVAFQWRETRTGGSLKVEVLLMPFYEISTNDLIPTKELLRLPMEARGFKATTASFSTWVGENPLSEEMFHTLMQDLWTKTLGHPIKVKVERIPEAMFDEHGVGRVKLA